MGPNEKQAQDIATHYADGFGREPERTRYADEIDYDGMSWRPGDAWSRHHSVVRSFEAVCTLWLRQSCNADFVAHLGDGGKAALVAEARNFADQCDMARRKRAWQSVVDAAGPRFFGENAKFIVSLPEQKAVFGKIMEYARRVAELTTRNMGLVLYGPPGTGKTLLTASLVRPAITADRRVEWWTAQELLAACRGLFDSDQSEEDFVKARVRPDVLVLDDLAPPSGSYTEFQAAWLLRIVDARYKLQRPCWVTMNVAGVAEAATRIGAGVADRLRDGALCLSCSWPSHRKAGTL